MESVSDAASELVATASDPSDTRGSTDEEKLLKQIAEIEKRIKQIEMRATSCATMPVSIRAKVDALRSLQLQIIDKEAKFHQMAYTMETDFQTEFDECHRAISRIVNGLETPQLVPEPAGSGDDVADQPNGVPEFWLTVLKASFLDGLVQASDEPALKSLTDIRCVLKSEPSEPGFTLEFHFAGNDYFTNEVLTKEYFLRCTPDADVPSNFNGFEIYRCTGCTIDWKPERNLVEQIAANTKSNDEPCDSFFKFFEPEQQTGADVDTDYHVAMMECDFHYGYYIKETVIPRAVFLFLGETVNLNECCSSCRCDRCLMYSGWLEDVCSDKPDGATAADGDTETNVELVPPEDEPL